MSSATLLSRQGTRRVRVEFEFGDIDTSSSNSHVQASKLWIGSQDKRNDDEDAIAKEMSNHVSDETA